MKNLVTLYYAEVCDVIPGVTSSQPERLTNEYTVLVDVPLEEAQAYVARFDHFRARWRYDPQPASIQQHSTVQERTEAVLQHHGVATGYKPQELDELLALYRALPAEHRHAVRSTLREVQP